MIIADMMNFRLCVLNENGMFLRQFCFIHDTVALELKAKELQKANVRVLRRRAMLLDGGRCHEYPIAKLLHPSCRTYSEIVQLEKEFHDIEKQLHHPISIQVLPDGERILVCDRQNQCVYVYGMKGAMVKWMQIDRMEREKEMTIIPFSSIQGIAIHTCSSLLIYLSDSFMNRIAVVNVDKNKIVGFIGASSYGKDTQCASGIEEGELRSPSGLVIWKDGTNTYLVVCDTGNHRIQLYHLPTNAFYMSIGAFGHSIGYFHTPTDVAILENTLYICDSLNHRVQALGLSTSHSRTQDKAASAVIGQESNLLSFPTHIAVSGALPLPPDGCNFGLYRSAKLVVSDTGHHRIVVFDLSSVGHGQVLFCIGKEQIGREYGAFQSPQGVAIESRSGCILVCDAENHRIQVFRRDGSFIHAFGHELKAEECAQYPQEILVEEGSVWITDRERMDICQYIQSMEE